MFRYAIVVGNVAVVIFCRPELYVPLFIESLSRDTAFIGYFLVHAAGAICLQRRTIIGNLLHTSIVANGLVGVCVSYLPMSL